VCVYGSLTIAKSQYIISVP